MDIIQILKELFVYDKDAPLIFNSGQFFLLFIAFIAYYAIAHRNKFRVTIYVIAFSFFFYYKSSGIYLWILAFTALSDFYFALLISRTKDIMMKKIWLTLSIGVSLGFLVYFKYTNFFLDSFYSIIENNFKPLDIFLPIGISFYTFQSISYVLDVYWKKLEPTTDVLDYAFFLSYFPQLVAGPIVKAKDFLPQLRKPIHISSQAVYSGLFLIIIGLLKKAVIADYISQYNDLIFRTPESYSGFENLMAVYGYTLQIYCDFSGYSDIAIGLGMLMGFNLGINFDFPYQSKNITEFWRRWHISLSSWLRDYLYIPIGGNRHNSGFSRYAIIAILFLTIALNEWSWLDFGIFALNFSLWSLSNKYTTNKKITYIAMASIFLSGIYFYPHNILATIYLFSVSFLWAATIVFPRLTKHVHTGINLMLTMLIGGLWHGASGKFIFWGAMHGVALGIHKFSLPWLKKIKDNPLTTFISWFLTFHFVVILWVFFRAQNFDTALSIIKTIATDTDFTYLTAFVSARSLFVIMLILGYIAHATTRTNSRQLSHRFARAPYFVKFLIFFITIQLIIQFQTEDIQPFIYFQF